MGNLKKGQIFTRTKDAGAFNEIQIGSIKAYVNKSDTNPLFNGTLTNPAGFDPASGEITLNLTQNVYSKTSTSEADVIGRLNDNQKISYLRVIDDWYEINFLGRKGYIQVETIEQ